ncbi:hypothetical protein BDZ94DRAFT_1278493 [Collybia nuda]|uniref:Uncharacterized protein n=1 Tax=Collybia nuda TaxID=64659 RepID=A0A9P6CAQ8_9AGAR|nr:hypothetical protein BDZ94DRAFT_1278493 [Collybia nuda]
MGGFRRSSNVLPVLIQTYPSQWVNPHGSIGCFRRVWSLDAHFASFPDTLISFREVPHLLMI